MRNRVRERRRNLRLYKSTSLTIGAEELSEKARALEQAGRNGDTEYIRQNHSELLEAYDKVCRSIQELE